MSERLEIECGPVDGKGCLGLIALMLICLTIVAVVKVLHS